MTMTVTDWIVLGLIVVSVSVAVVWQIRLSRRNAAAKKAQTEKTEETV